MGRFSGGVTVFVRNELIDLGIISRIFETCKDCVILHLKGDHFGLENDIILLFTYLSPEGSTIYENLEGNTNGVELFEEEILSPIITNYPDANIFLAGDMNSRTSSLSDCISNDNVEFIFEDNSVYFSDDFDIIRNSRDQTENAFGLSLIKLCKTYGIHILNGRLHDDKDGNFTCVTHNGASVVDYFIASSYLFQYCTEFEIGDMYQSVHFPVSCKFTFNVPETHSFLNERDTGINFAKFRWNENKKEEFLTKFRQQFELIKDTIISNIDISCQDSLKLIVNLYQTTSNCMRIRTHDYSNIRENPWWDTQCENVKRDKLYALNKLRSFPSPLNLTAYKYQRCRLKNIVKEKKHRYSESQKSKLLESRNDPKTFWKNVKNIRNRSINANKISLDS